MFVDIYSLNRGGVSHIEDFCKFAINNLQVLRGYRYAKVPPEVRKVACGTLGDWKPGDPPPRLEIVHHHEAPVVYPKIPEKWRTMHFQAAGTARRLVPVTNPTEKAFFPGEEAYTVDMKVDSRPKRVVPSLEDVLPGLMQEVAAPQMTARPPQAADAAPKPRQPEIGPPPAQQLSARPILSTPQDVVEAALDASSDRCQGKKGDGTSCPRRARPGTVYCGAHGGRKAVLT